MKDFWQASFHVLTYSYEEYQFYSLTTHSTTATAKDLPISDDHEKVGNT